MVACDLLDLFVVTEDAGAMLKLFCFYARLVRFFRSKNGITTMVQNYQRVFKGVLNLKRFWSILIVTRIIACLRT